MLKKASSDYYKMFLSQLVSINMYGWGSELFPLQTGGGGAYSGDSLNIQTASLENSVNSHQATPKERSDLGSYYLSLTNFIT